MQQRLRQFKNNVRTSDLIKTVLFVPVFAVIAFFLFPLPEFLIALLLLTLSFFMPYLVRNKMVADLDSFIRVANRMPAAFSLVLLVVGSQLQESPRAFMLLIILAGLYVGTFFWVLSEPGVYVTRK